MRRVHRIGMICVEFLPHIIHTYTMYYYFLTVNTKRYLFLTSRKILVKLMTVQNNIYHALTNSRGKLWDVKFHTGTSMM